MVKKEICYGAVPVRKKDVWQVFLVLHRNGNYWGFPKGHIEKKEFFIKEAFRELKEETNFDVSFFIEKPVLKEEYSFFRDLKKVEKEVFYYIVQVRGDIKFQKKEILDGRWVDIEEAYGLITFSESRKLCEKVRDILKNPGFKKFKE